jgi:hypothetical protein
MKERGDSKLREPDSKLREPDSKLRESTLKNRALGSGSAREMISNVVRLLGPSPGRAEKRAVVDRSPPTRLQERKRNKPDQPSTAIPAMG